MHTHDTQMLPKENRKELIAPEVSSRDSKCQTILGNRSSTDVDALVREVLCYLPVAHCFRVRAGLEQQCHSLLGWGRCGLPPVHYHRTEPEGATRGLHILATKCADHNRSRHAGGLHQAFHRDARWVVRLAGEVRSKQSDESIAQFRKYSRAFRNGIVDPLDSGNLCEDLLSRFRVLAGR